METIKGSELAKVKKEEGMERQNTVAGSAGGGGGALHVCEHGIFVLPTRFCYDPQAPLNISLFLQNKTIVLFNYRILRCFMLLIGKGHGKPLQCSCLENPIGGGAWRTVSIKLHSRA